VPLARELFPGAMSSWGNHEAHAAWVNQLLGKKSSFKYVVSL